MIAPDNSRGAFVLTGYNNQVISRPALINSSDSYRVSAMFLLRDPTQYWYVRLRADRDELEFASPGSAAGSFVSRSCTRCMKERCV
jgi:hypothetical protein